MTADSGAQVGVARHCGPRLGLAALFCRPQGQKNKNKQTYCRVSFVRFVLLFACLL